jgi:hypothetical protein
VFLDIHAVCSSSKFYLILSIVIDVEYNTTNKTNTNCVAWKDENCLSALIIYVGEVYKGCG